MRIPAYRNEPCGMVLKSPNAQMGLVSELVQKECEFEAVFRKQRNVTRKPVGCLLRMRITTGEFKSSAREAGRNLCCTGDR